MNYTKNTDPFYYDDYQGSSNCGSFAFNVEEWYDPEVDFSETVGFIDDWIADMGEAGYNNDEIADIYVEALTERVLKDFEGEVRELTDKDDVRDNEELIALRAYCESRDFIDYDFHFKVLRNGIWQEKCGTNPIKFCLEDDWTYMVRTYNSETIYFAHLVD